MIQLERRTEKELLELMLVNIHLLAGGLCYLNDQLYCRGLLNDAEHSIVHRYIKHNRPSAFSSLNALVCCDSDWYWPKGKVTPRVKWLKKHIKKLS